MFALDIELNLITNWREREREKKKNQLGCLLLLTSSLAPASMLELRRTKDTISK